MEIAHGTKLPGEDIAQKRIVIRNQRELEIRLRIGVVREWRWGRCGHFFRRGFGLGDGADERTHILNRFQGHKLALD